jgi:hypothetical protein
MSGDAVLFVAGAWRYGGQFKPMMRWKEGRAFIRDDQLAERDGR